MELIYKINDKPPISKMILAAFQQLLAILTGTITMPMIVGHGMSHSAALSGDGLGSITGAFLGGCPNTTYGESISCVAFSHNASIWTLLTAAIMAVVLSFIGPLMCFFKSVPPCIVGGISFALLGFIAASGLQMLKGTDFSKSKNIFVVAAILVGGVGGLTLQLRNVVISPVACALFLGVIVNLMVNIKMPKKDKDENS